MKHWLCLILFICFSLSIFARNPLEPSYYAAPPRLPNVLPEMNTPGFWISRHPHPDTLIMTSGMIDKYNQRVNKLGTYTKIHLHSSVISGITIRNQIKSLLSTIASIGKYNSAGERTQKAVLDSLRRNANLEKVPLSIKVRFGYPVKHARQRFAPGLNNLNKEVFDTEFDEMQNSGYDIGTPTVFYHDSADGKWVFGACATSTGWYLKSEVCFLPQKQWLAYQQAESFVVSTAARADLWKDAQASQYHGFCRMGTKLPLIGETDAYFQVQIPVKDSLMPGYIAKEDASQGYLPYTARNVYKQAFRLLNMPYGWGDTDADFDCSSLLKHIFACFGFKLPRNGLQQAKAAKLIYDFGPVGNEASREKTIINEGLPGISFLRLNGHIMLYIGHYNGRAYVLHDTWGYRVPAEDSKDDVYVINKVVVSDLYLSKDSQRGSLLNRLTHLSAMH